MSPNFTKVARGINVQPLKRYLKENSVLWDDNTIRQDFPNSPHIDTKCIYIRGPIEFTPEEYQGNLYAKDYAAPLALREMLYYMFSDFKHLIPATEIGYVLIVNLLAGGEVFEHTDEGRYAEYYDRYHLVVQSSEGNVFTVNGEDAIMREGEIWSFNHRVPHSVVNFSTEDRIHIIFDVK